MNSSQPIRPNAPLTASAAFDHVQHPDLGCHRGQDALREVASWLTPRPLQYQERGALLLNFRPIYAKIFREPSTARISAADVFEWLQTMQGCAETILDQKIPDPEQRDQLLELLSLVHDSLSEQPPAILFVQRLIGRA